MAEVYMLVLKPELSQYGPPRHRFKIQCGTWTSSIEYSLKELKDKNLKEKLQNASAGEKIRCADTNEPKPNPKKLQAFAGAQIEAQQQQPGDRLTGQDITERIAQNASSQQKGRQERRNSQETLYPLTDVVTEQQDVYALIGQKRIKLNDLKLSNQLLGTLKDSQFSDRNELLAYAPDLREGLGNTPDVDRNPYNFAAWHGEQPWESEAHPEADAHPAQHHRFYPGAYSGVIEVKLTAKTPLFIPALDSATGTMTEQFFELNNAPAIPGSSLKGAVRSLVEVLSNSRCGVTDKQMMQFPPLYRRRATELYQIVQAPVIETINGRLQCTQDGSVKRCKFDYVGWDNRLNKEVLCPKRGHNPFTQQDIDNYYQKKPSRITFVEDWRANLFWVDRNDYNHGLKEGIAYAQTNETLCLPKEVVNAYLSMMGHEHFKTHPDNVKKFKGRSGYRLDCVPHYEHCEAAIFALDQHMLIHGIHNPKQPKHLLCFGKNVNFLWPAENSPRKLLAGFAQRDTTESHLSRSDLAEQMFGFIGDHKKKTPDSPESHSFKGRIRFTPCLATNYEKASEPVQLMPLTSPSGSKLKSRPLYLQPASDNHSADYSDHQPKLKGRKFYWHQKSPASQLIAKVHDYTQLQQINGAISLEKDQMLPEPMCPLLAGACFEGQVHFTNLQAAELGALLGALDPSLLFAEPQPLSEKQYGIKLGKAKPYGLGSIAAELNLKLLNSVAEIYQELSASVFQDQPEKNMADFIRDYKAWACKKAVAKDWRDLPFSKDLAMLLQFPEETSIRVYPPKFNMYNWLPDLNEPHGDKSTRPKAMKQARGLKP